MAREVGEGQRRKKPQDGEDFTEKMIKKLVPKDERKGWRPRGQVRLNTQVWAQSRRTLNEERKLDFVVEEHDLTIEFYPETGLTKFSAKLRS